MWGDAGIGGFFCSPEHLPHAISAMFYITETAVEIVSAKIRLDRILAEKKSNRITV